MKQSIMKQSITEDMHVHNQWYIDAREQTPNTILQFMDHLIYDYEHDYGTICHAITAAAIAAAYAVDKTEQGGITGFQAGAIMWEFIIHWMHYEDQPLSLVKYEEMLYPQYRDRFRTVSADTWKWLQEKAQENLDNAAGSMVLSSAVVEHWKLIVEGIVPFGYTVQATSEEQ